MTLLTPSGVVDPLAVSPPLAEKLPIALAEDAVFSAAHGAAILSTDPGRPIFNPFTAEGDEAASPGGVLVWLDLASNTHRALEVSGWPEGRLFHPLGVALKGDVLAVANLAVPPGVEILRLGGEKATWERTLAHDAVQTPNSVVVLSDRQVLVTNSFRFPARTHPKLNKAETALGWPLGRVYLLTCSEGETSAEVVSEGLALANGLALSKDGRVLVAAASVGQEVQVYDVDPPALSSTSPAAIKYRETLPVGFTVDNLRFVSGGDGGNYTFLAAGHPSAFAYMETAARKGAPPLSGSAVVKFTLEAARERDTAQQARAEVNRLFTKRDKRVQVVLEDSGQVIGTSSTALPLPDSGMLVTGLFDPGVLRARDVDLSPVVV